MVQNGKKLYEVNIVEYPCFDCNLEKRKQGFPTTMALKEHIKYMHEPDKLEHLRPMYKKGQSSNISKVKKPSTETSTSNQSKSLLPPLRTIIGIKNSSGMDCFSISVLHLLAQTDFAKIVKPCPIKSCVSPVCLLGQFFSNYMCPKDVPLDITRITKNYHKFGLRTIQEIDCGDFLRGLLSNVAKDQVHMPNEIHENSFFNVDWKFECPNCRRYMTMTLKDYCVKIKVSQENALAQLLEDFLYTKSCPCGQYCRIEPTVKHLGKYLFLEIDRAVYSGKKIFC